MDNLNLIFPEILIINIVRYKVIPIGIKTTIPAIKLFRILANNDFFVLSFVIILRITRVYNKSYY